ncbi:MAG: tRNA (cmo5U34)-methyltransferase [Cellvibrionaceae bacterium]
MSGKANRYNDAHDVFFAPFLHSRAPQAKVALCRIMPTDNIFANPMDNVPHFDFDETVAAVFPDMIERSVPGYHTILCTIGDMAERYAQTSSRCYDLGCSLGAASLAMARGIAVDDCSIIAVDNSPSMIKRCRQAMASNAPNIFTELHCCDLEAIPIENASMVVLNFTLQFVPLEKRQSIIDRIYRGLRPGGLLFISEKIRFDDEANQQLMTELYHKFKRANGYSELEITQKDAALTAVLVPETFQAHKQRLRRSGFDSINIWFQCLNFASFTAVRSR